MGSNAKCLVCNNVVEANSKPSLKDVDTDDEEDGSDPSYLMRKNKQRIRLLKNYLSLFCKLINLNLDHSFGHLFPSTAAGENGSEGIFSPSCCSRCFALLINIWKIQQIIKQTLDLQETDVNILKQLLLENPSHKNAIQRGNEIKSSNGSLTINNDAHHSISITKSCSVILTRCDDVPSTLNKTLISFPVPSPNVSSARSKPKHMELVKNLTAKHTSEEIKTENDTDYEPNWLNEDCFDSQDLASDSENIDTEEEINPNIFSATRLRLANFSSKEVAVLVKLMKENFHILYKPKSKAGGNKQARLRLYKKMTDDVNQVGGWGRSITQIRDKIKFLRKTVDFTNLNIASTTSTKNDQVDSEDSNNAVSQHLMEPPSEDSETQDDSLPIPKLVLVTSIIDENLIDLDQESSEDTKLIRINSSRFPNAPRNRLANFSDEENQVFSKLLKENWNALFPQTAKFNTVSHRYRRDQIIIQIANAVNKVGGKSRSTGQIREKLNHLKLQKVQVGQPKLTPEKVQPNQQELLEGNGRRPRFANFSKEEVQLLIKLMQENSVMFGRKTSKRTRQKILTKITNAVNQLGGPPRSEEQIRDKLTGLRLLINNKKIDPSTGDALATTTTKRRVRKVLPVKDDNANENNSGDAFGNAHVSSSGQAEPTLISKNVPLNQQDFLEQISRRRFANFLKEEVQLLIKLMHENAVMFGRKTSKRTRQKILTKITNAVNQLGGTPRSEEQIRDKLKGLRLLINNKKIDPLTGDALATTKGSVRKVLPVKDDDNANENDSGDEFGNARVSSRGQAEPKLMPKNVSQNQENLLEGNGRRPRFANFSKEEVQLLIKLMHENSVTFGGKISNRTRQKILTKITNAVNQLGGTPRSEKQIRDKLKGLRLLINNKKIDPSLLTSNVEHHKAPIIAEDDADFQDSEDSMLPSEDADPKINNRHVAFSTAEVDALLKFMNEYNSANPKGEERTKVLIKMTNAVNLVGGLSRSSKQVDSKIKNMVSKMKRKKLETLQQLPGDGAIHPHHFSLETETNEDNFPLPKPGRFANFSKDQVQLLTKLMHENSELFERKSSKETKQNILIKITNAVNELGGPPRSEDQIRDKMKGIRNLIQNKKIDFLTGDTLVTKKGSSTSKAKRRKYQCSKCNRHFDIFYKLQAHELTHLPKALRPLFHCSKCDDKFLSKAAVACHMIRIHKDAPIDRPRSKVKFLICKICDQKFFWYEGTKFRRHVQSHAGDSRARPFMCDICGKDFFEKSSLEKHAKIVHSTERQYQCEFCVENYKHSENLRRHLKICHKDRVSDPVSKKILETRWEYSPNFIGPKIAYPCQFCEKAFQVRSHMTKHLLVCKARTGMKFE